MSVFVICLVFECRCLGRVALSFLSLLHVWEVFWQDRTTHTHCSVLIICLVFECECSEKELSSCFRF